MKPLSLFDYRAFYRGLFAIAVPIMLQNLVNSLVNVVDTMMIGRLGTTEIAAVGLANNVFFLFTMVLFGICSGGAIFTAQFWGRRDIRGIRKNMGLCLILAAGTALVFTGVVLAVPEGILGIYSKDPAVVEAGSRYLRTLSPSFVPFAVSFVFTHTLRSVERVRLATAAAVAALVVNMGLNRVLIFGAGPVPALGVTGAAAATVSARFVEFIILTAASYKQKNEAAGTAAELLSFNRAFAGRFLSITVPVIGNEIIWALGITVQNVIFARTGTGAAAAFNITNTVSQLAWVMFIGLGNGAAVLIGKRIGEGAEDAARNYARRVTVFAPVLAAAAALCLYPLSRLLPLVFRVSPEVLGYTSIMFVILCLSYPFRAFNMTLIVGVCRAGGDTVFCVLFEVIFMWCYSLPLAAALAWFGAAPVWVIYLILCSEDVWKMICGLWRLGSGRWLNNVIG